MIFTEENLRYCLLSWDPYEEHTGNSYGGEPLPISGLYNWANALGGVRKYPSCPEELADYNLFHINITARNLLLLSTFLKQKPKGAKLILNIDFAVELWRSAFTHPDFLLDQIDRADYIFSVEPLMAEILGTALKRNVACIPHPVSVEQLILKRKERRLNQIGFALHRYDMNDVVPAFVARQLPAGFQTIALGSTETKRNLLHMYTFMKESCAFEELMELTSSLYAVYETYTIHSYGRYSVECAALGVPCVGPAMVSSIKDCFPDLALQEPNDVNGGARLLNKLIAEPEFYLDVISKATERVQKYSLKESRKRLLTFLNTGA